MGNLAAPAQDTYWTFHRKQHFVINFLLFTFFSYAVLMLLFRIYSKVTRENAIVERRGVEMGRENEITRKMTKIISDRSPGADGEGDASERHELFIIMQKTWKICYFLALFSVRSPISPAGALLSPPDQKIKSVVIGKKMCHRVRANHLTAEMMKRLFEKIKTRN